MVALPAPADATRLLSRLREASGDAVVTFEYINRHCLDLVLEHIPGTTDPLDSRFAHYALVELAAGSGGARVAPVLEDLLAEGLEAGRVLDAALASSASQASKLWRLRETIPEAARADGGCISHDVSVPVSRVAELLERGATLCERAIAGARVIAFGHLGDGNIHFNVARPRDAAPAPFLARRADLTPMVDDLVSELDGSFSAEHGIGQIKREQLRRYRSGTELAVMEKIKAALDPPRNHESGQGALIGRDKARASVIDSGARPCWHSSSAPSCPTVGGDPEAAFPHHGIARAGSGCFRVRQGRVPGAPHADRGRMRGGMLSLPAGRRGPAPASVK